MRRMLDPTKVGGIPSTIEFDKDGNRTADKDLKVNGKLKLQSLVSNTNPDGDITKELAGGGKLYRHYIELKRDNFGFITLQCYINRKEAITSIAEFIKVFHTSNISCSGCVKINDSYYNAASIGNATLPSTIYAKYFDYNDQTTHITDVSQFNITDHVYDV